MLGIFLAPVVLYLLLLSFAGLFFLASALPVEQPQLVGCQTGRLNMEVVDTYAERKTFGPATAPSYGFI